MTDLPPSDSQADFSVRGAKPLPGSEGKKKERVTFHAFRDEEIAHIAILKLSEQESQKSPQEISLSPLKRLRFTPIRVQDATGKLQTVLVNIRSAIKRLKALGATEAEVKEGLKAGSLSPLIEKLATYEKQVKARVSAGIEQLHKEHGIASKIEPAQIQKVATFAREHRFEKSRYFKGTTEGPLRGFSVEFDKEGHLFVHLTKVKIGSGSFKVVRPAIGIEANRIFASIRTFEPDWNEIHNLELMKNVSGCLHLCHIVEDLRVASKGYMSISKEKARFVTELYGQDLEKTLKDPQLSRQDRLQIMTSAIKGLKQIHDTGILHRDIKPANILVKKQDGRVIDTVFCDFGLSCGAKSEARANVAGTPFYFSPEYMRNMIEIKGTFENVTTFANDVWALGCTLFRTLQMGVNKGKLPWEGKPDNEVASLQEGWLPEPAHNTPEHLIWEMLQLDPKKRPSMVQIEAQLNQMLS